jgi:predicted xylose isomerase-like sugar epimerase
MKSEEEVTVGALTAAIGTLGALIQELTTQGVIDPTRFAASIHDMKSDRSPFRTADGVASSEMVFDLVLHALEEKP